MRRSYISLLSLFLIQSVVAQKINVSWSGSEVNNFGEIKKTLPKVANQQYTTDGNNIYITLNKKTESNSLRIGNVTWEKAPINELFDLNALSIPEREIAGVSTSYDETQGNVAHVMVSGFKNENGIIYRLTSFEILPNNISSAKKIAANRSISTAKLTTENPLKVGNFYKIKVDKSGVFKITTKFLKDNGINPTNINPKNLRIYGNGGVALSEYYNDFHFDKLQENAIQVVGEEDGKWDDGDYALFYAQGPNGFNVYQNPYNNNGRVETRTDASLHFQNIYEDYAYYYINFDKGEGKRVVEKDSTIPTDLISRYDAYQFIDEDKTNLLKLGRIWVSDPINTTKKVTFKTNSSIQPNDEIYYRTSVVAYNSQNNSVAFDVNGQKAFTSTIGNTADKGYQKVNNFRGTISNLSGNEISINITPNTGANPNGLFYFDYTEVLYKEDLKYNDAQMNFRSYDIMEGTQTEYGFSLANSANAEQVWEVSNPTNATKKINKSGNNSVFNFGYLADTFDFNNEFVAFKNSAAYTPTFVSKIENSDLSTLTNVNYLIITQKDMLREAKRLADYHSTKSGFTTEVVDVEKIYNEYGSGSKDISAIRNFIYNLKNNGNLKYVLLIGDGSYDFKNRTKGNNNIIPSYQSEESGNFVSSFVTDDYFVMTKPGASPYISANLPEIPIGRLPASNVSEAKSLVDKTLAYYNALPGQSSPFGEWRMKLDFVVDDDADGTGPFHNIVNQSIKDNFEAGIRSEYNERKLYLDAFPPEMGGGGQRFPQINQAINNDMGNSLYMFYFGHGGVNGWAQERVLTLGDVQGYNNFTAAYSRFPLVSTITCEFTLWDNPEVASAGEELMKLKTGGAATMITSSRAIAVTYGEDFTRLFTNRIFEFTNNDFHRLGDAHLQAKKDKGLDGNHLKVNFLGDPAMKLSRPKQLLTIDNIDSPVTGQLRALDFVKISGQINKEDGTLDTSFNGKVAINIFDKILNKETRNNDGGLLPKLQYQEENAPIVKASGKAVNGKYTVEFYVPKDINYDLGDGRILGYADNFETAKSNAYDVFNTQTYKVGDINPNPLNDSQAPKVNLYMNNTNFADGGITDQNPMLLACVSDDTGINSTGSGVGHDITVVLDGQVVNTTVLNDFFTSGGSNGCNSDMQDYQKGSVSYPFRNLTPGNHQLVFKVWDINNNSTTTTLNFVVKDEDEQKLVLKKLLNWPNPFTDKTYIQFEHNCDDILDVNVQIYTITGKLVRSFSQSVTSGGFLQGYRTQRDAILWDGKDDFGATVGKGTYIFKVYAKSQNQDKCKGGATAVEKMVLLK